MPNLRIQPGHQTDAAIEELEVLTTGDRGLSAVRSGSVQVELAVGRQTWPAKIIVRDAVSRRDAQALVETEARGSKVIVANQLSEEAKDYLTEHNARLRSFGWSWLDRRGELQLNHPHASGVIHFDSTVVPTGGNQRWKTAAPGSDGPIRGRAGIGWTSALLLDPDEPPSIRAVARETQMSHGAIGEASKRLREAGLVLPSGQPDIPDLFWALAAVWGPTRAAPVTSVPTMEVADRLHANADGPAQSMIPGWCLGGDESAAAWGAPLFAAGVRPWIWVPTEGDGRRAERALGTASWDESAAVVAVPPTALVCLRRTTPPTDERALSFLPTAHPLFLALNLAQDPSRGREILDQWHLDQPGFRRVW